jgi:hypothetical protein
MVPNSDQSTPNYHAVTNRQPGGAVICPYCQRRVEYHVNGHDLVQSNRGPLRYSRPKTEDRARNYGQVFLNQAGTTPKEWVAHDKGMPGALQGYRYVEDP